MSEPKKDTVKRLLCFVGLRQGRKGKKQHLWVEVDSLNETPDPYEHTDRYGNWTKQIQRGAVPGAVYESDCVVGKDGRVGSVILHAGTYAGRLANEDRVAEWQLRHKTISMSIAAQSKARTDARERLDLARLEPLRNAYCKASRTEAAHLLAEVIRAVTSPNELT